MPLNTKRKIMYAEEADHLDEIRRATPLKRVKRVRDEEDDGVFQHVISPRRRAGGRAARARGRARKTSALVPRRARRIDEDDVVVNENDENGSEIPADSEGKLGC